MFQERSSGEEHSHFEKHSALPLFPPPRAEIKLSCTVSLEATLQQLQRAPATCSPCRNRAASCGSEGFFSPVLPIPFRRHKLSSFQSCREESNCIIHSMQTFPPLTILSLLKAKPNFTLIELIQCFVQTQPLYLGRSKSLFLILFHSNLQSM